MSKKKIFVVFSSASGHVNPVCGVVRQLCQHPNVECFFYGIEDHREAIERTGAQFRLYSDRNVADTVLPKVSERHKEFVFARFMNRMIDASYKILPGLIRDVADDKPDLIIVDPGFITSKYLVEIVKKRGFKVKCVEFFPHFVMTQQLLASVPGLMPANFKMVLSIIYILLRQLWLCWSFGISFYSPTDLLIGKKEHLKIVAVFPELHPDISSYDQSYKFVGNCVSEETRSVDFSSDQELNLILEDKQKSGDNLKLVYMSLGTVFNHNLSVFEMFIKAINEFPSRNSKSFQLKVIISVGEVGLKELKTVAPNVILRSKVPQLEILKRADLFITHCGMNSASETIKYAVPVVGVPIEGDQPIVARRLCDQLLFGIRLDPLKLSVDAINLAIEEVLTDPKFKNRITEFSKISSSYNGTIDATRLILDYLEQKPDQDKKKE